ncbi:MAG: 2'-5' RNA ligase family protein [Actinomycetota bacterium]|nr:2'-5' RNA ligase family protein [Actinomycetota bacterium]
MVPVPAAPLILTVALDGGSSTTFDALRRAHFPPERNHLSAHVTLFHALPGEDEAGIVEDVRAAALRPGFPIEVSGVRSLGRGVAYVLHSPPLEELRSELAGRWADRLSTQDRGRFRPHVTVQNKVDPAAARALLGELERTFEAWTCTAEGLSLSWYRGGPWEHLVTVGFGR